MSNQQQENKRIYYAIKAIAAEPIDSSGNKLGQKIKLQGLQSVSMNTSFDYEPVSQFGSLALYDQARTDTNVEMELSKIIDNKPPLYLLLTQGISADSSKKNIYDLGERRSDMYLGIWSDTNSFASGESIQTVRCSGMSITNVEYSFTFNNFLETVTLQGNNKIWLSAPDLLEAQNPEDGSRHKGKEWESECDSDLCSYTPNNDVLPDNVIVADIGSIDFNNSILPTGQGGIYGSINDLKIISINIKCEIQREKIYQIGSAVPAKNYIINPTVVNCYIETLMSPEELSKFNEYQNKKYVASLVKNQNNHPVVYDIKFPPDPDNNWWKGGTKLLGPNGNEQICSTEIPEHTFPKNIKIKIKNCNNVSKKTQKDTSDLYIDLGNENRINSIDYTSNTSGDSVVVRYNFKNYNYFAVEHSKVAEAGRFTVEIEPPKS
jgi:hypothetical protein